ncbi:hypothetical protein CYMTET_20862 [Cymbomonas tetramitiformis]|uniref:Transcription factor TFIIB cyclin-like domain-containing protein n=1 Tax=Cymbomonas tetramitiformis TaxID=36881 RepID=A0AAE0L3T0_9CHLO|nr:hypothetical protein CYMTET_20862 [Cymbomonas tetramitiformis]
MKELLSVLKKHRGTTGRARKATIAALLFTASHIHGTQGWSMRGASDVAARNAVLTLTSVLLQKNAEATSQLFRRSGYSNLKLIVVSVCSELSLTPDVVNAAVKISQLIREDAILDGKRDVTVATAAVFCAMNALKIRPSLQVIAEKAGITKETLARASKTVMAKERLWTQLLALASSSFAGTIHGAAFQSTASSSSMESSAEACSLSQEQHFTPLWEPCVERRRRRCAFAEERLSTA